MATASLVAHALDRRDRVVNRRNARIHAESRIQHSRIAYRGALAQAAAMLTLVEGIVLLPLGI